MNNRRTVLVAAAVLLGVIAFIGNMLYLHGVDQRAYGDAKLVRVFAVQKDIPKGLSGDDAIANGYIHESATPQKFRPGTAINSASELKGRVAVNAVSVGQVVVTGQFLSPNLAQSTFSQSIPAGQTAVTISIDPTHGVAGGLSAGDKVNLFVYGTKDVTGGTTAVRLLYQNVNILAVGMQTPVPAGSTADVKAAAATAAASSRNLVTLAVPVDAAQKIILAAAGANGATIYLTLMPPNNEPIQPVPGALDSLTGLNSSKATPYDQ